MNGSSKNLQRTAPMFYVNITDLRHFQVCIFNLNKFEIALYFYKAIYLNIRQYLLTTHYRVSHHYQCKVKAKIRKYVLSLMKIKLNFIILRI